MSYESTTHKLNLTGGQISTVLYCLEGYIAGLDDVVTQDENDKQLISDVDNIFAELQSVTDNYYAQLEEENDTLVVENSGKPYTFPLTKRTH